MTETSASLASAARSGGYQYPYPLRTAVAVCLSAIGFYGLFAARINPDLTALVAIWFVLLISLRDHRYLLIGWFLLAPYFPFGERGQLNLALNLSHNLLVPLVAVTTLSNAFFRGKRVALGKEDFFYIAFLLYAVFSAYYASGGTYGDLKVVYSIYLLPFLLYTVTKHLTMDRHFLTLLAYASLFHLATLSVTAYFEYTTGISLYTGYLRWGDVGLGRIAGPFASPIIFGLFITFLSLLLYMGYRLGAVSLPVFIASAVVAGGLCLLTFTRSVWLGVLTSTVFVLIKEKPSKISRAFALLGVAVVAATVGLFLASDPALAERALNTQTGSHRLGVAYGSLKLIADYPVLGAGFGTFDDVLPKYLPNYLLSAKVQLATSHVTLFTLLAELGMAGTLLLIAFLISVLAPVQDARSLLASDERLLATINYGFILAFVVNAFLIDMRFFSLAYCWLFISLGLIQSIRRGASPLSQ